MRASLDDDLDSFMAHRTSKPSSLQRPTPSHVARVMLSPESLAKKTEAAEAAAKEAVRAKAALRVRLTTLSEELAETKKNHRDTRPAAAPGAAVVSSVVQARPTHAVLCIDQSGSMSKRDVVSPQGSHISRWEAVFDSAGVFLLDQERHAGGSQVQFSLILFHEGARTVFERLPLTEARKALLRARDGHTPQGGTCFAAGLQQVRHIAQADGMHGVMVLFLSDGRPGDLPGSPSRLIGQQGHGKMPLEYRAHGALHASTAVHLQVFMPMPFWCSLICSPTPLDFAQHFAYSPAAVGPAR